MPFKTKKKKEIAKTRRIAISQQGLAFYESKVKSNDETTSEVEIKPKKVKYDIGKHDYIKGEIIRISVLAFIIIGLQVALRISNIAF